MVLFLTLAILVGVQWYLPGALLVFPTPTDVEQYSVLVHLYMSFCQVSARVFCPRLLGYSSFYCRFVGVLGPANLYQFPREMSRNRWIHVSNQQEAGALAGGRVGGRSWGSESSRSQL